jgi:hypothetical protein
VALVPAGPAGVDRLIAKDEIKDVIYQWSRGVARKDWDLVGSCYTPDGQDNHGSVNGGVDAFLGWMKEYHAHIEQAIFYSTNILIEFVDDTHALVESHGISFQRHDAGARDARVQFLGPDWADREVPIVITFAGRKLDEFVKLDEGWRIAKRQQVYEMAEARPSSNALVDSPTFRVARRDGEDALFDAREAIGLPRAPTLVP